MKRKCLNCDNMTRNPKFCSRSCAASVNNSEFPKRLAEGKCKSCGIALTVRLNYCKNCQTRGQDVTVNEAIYSNSNKANAFALIRNRARSKMQKLGFKSCSKCGYSKHVEVCHIKPIAQFSLDALLSEVNHESNLIILCPNCHWEFDHPEVRD
jgi:5-methylcytosine-specific restriction endonuclease McrA